jgi:hypothetical protein
MTEDEFEYWLAHMDDALAEFIASLPPEVGNRLDYTIDSLDVLEAWTLSRYQDPNKLLQPSESPTLGGIARYIGETIRKNIGGRWRIRLDNPNYVYYGIPELGEFAEKSTPTAPHSLATAAADRRLGNYWSGVARNMARRYGQASVARQ